MAWTLCTSGSAVAKAGNHCSSISGSATTMAEWSTEAEGTICGIAGTDFITNYSNLLTPLKYMLADICSSMIAINIQKYDPTGYLINEADYLFNANDEIVQRGLGVLKDRNSNILKTP